MARINERTGRNYRSLEKGQSALVGKVMQRSNNAENHSRFRKCKRICPISKMAFVRENSISSW
jgi:hypothetical protein